MKCTACKYEFVQDFINGDQKNNYIVKGDDFFISIVGSFHMVIDRGSYYEEEKRVSLKACPKCNTVILDDRF